LVDQKAVEMVARSAEKTERLSAGPTVASMVASMVGKMADTMVGWKVD
jgi:hypothetical protein